MTISPAPRRYTLTLLSTLAGETPPPSLTDLLKTTPGLQDQLDTLIEERLARAGGGGGGRGGVRLPSEIAKELEDLRKFKLTADQQKALAEGNYNAALQSATEEFRTKEKSFQEERDQLLRDIRHDRVESRLVIEATAAKAKNPKAIAKLLADRVDLDDNRQVIVKDASGKPIYKGGALLQVKDLVAQHMREEPWAYDAEGDRVPEGSPATRRGGGDGDLPSNDQAGLDAEIAEAQKAYDTAHAAAMRGGASPSAISLSKTAKRKLTELLEKRDKAKK